MSRRIIGLKSSISVLQEVCRYIAVVVVFNNADAHFAGTGNASQGEGSPWPPCP